MLSGDPFRVLVVCIGNVCRSPLAERLLAQRLDDLGVGASYDVGSAGTRGLVGRPMEPDAAAQLRALGGDPEGFVARRLGADVLRGVGLILTATTDVRRQVLAEAPGAMKRTFTLRELALLVDEGADRGADRGAEDGPEDGALFAGFEGPAALVADAARRRGSVGGLDLDIPDPMGKPVDVHETAARAIADAVDPVAVALAAVVRRSPR